MSAVEPPGRQRDGDDGVEGGGVWDYGFTQEWPLGGMRHQLSYTVPMLDTESSGTGIGLSPEGKSGNLEARLGASAIWRVRPSVNLMLKDCLVRRRPDRPPQSGRPLGLRLRQRASDRPRRGLHLCPRPG